MDSKKSQQPIKQEYSQFKKNNPFIVTICVSAGGLAPLKTFFMHTTPTNQIAFIIITQSTPDHLQLVSQLLTQYTELTVLTITHRHPIAADHIYLLPAEKNAAIYQNVLTVTEPTFDFNSKNPIDSFLSSFAKDQEKRAICILLSEVEQDGMLGLRALRQQGSLIIAQTERHARYDSMPKSPINSGLVDYVLHPEDMHAFLSKYVAHYDGGTLRLADSISVELQRILILLKTQTGYDFSLYKPNTIFRRIQKRMDTLQLDTLSEYVYFLHQTPKEVPLFFKELLINVTHFFRDADVFERLKVELLKSLSSIKFKDNYFRVWVPACSTGEEAYSIAILLQECMTLLKRSIQVQIFATDIDPDAIETARRGQFSTTIEKNISAERLQHFFKKNEHGYKVKPEIRKLIIFAVQNIIADPPFTKLNLLSCRNLLIYLKPLLQRKILPLFHYSLNPQGLLLLGYSENINNSSDFFNILDKKWKIFQRNDSKTTTYDRINYNFNYQLSGMTSVKMTEKNLLENEPNLSNLVKNFLLSNYTPACIVIDEKGNIVYIYGRTSKFLEFAPGEVRTHFMDMIRPDLKSKLHFAIHKAASQQKEIIFDKLQLTEDEDRKYVNVRVKPLTETESNQKKLLLIIIEETIPPEQATIQPETSIAKGDMEKKFIQLEQELIHAKENLQLTIEELETSNEELKSSNEELHSLNEELTTVNTDLENRIDQLSIANEDITNLLDNTDIASIFLDTNLCIKRFTPRTTEIINLIPSDVGRPIQHIVSNLHCVKFIDDAKAVLKTLEPITTDGKDKIGREYLIRIAPLRTVTNIVDGIVITFFNIQTDKQAETKSTPLELVDTDTKKLHHALVTTAPNPIIILDKECNIIATNNQFLKQFNIKNNKIIGQSIYQLNLDWDKDHLKQLIDDILTQEILSKVANLEIAPGKVAAVNAHKISTSTILLELN